MFKLHLNPFKTKTIPAPASQPTIRERVSKAVQERLTTIRASLASLCCIQPIQKKVVVAQQSKIAKVAQNALQFANAHKNKLIAAAVIGAAGTVAYTLIANSSAQTEITKNLFDQTISSLKKSLSTLGSNHLREIVGGAGIGVLGGAVALLYRRNSKHNPVEVAQPPRLKKRSASGIATKPKVSGVGTPQRDTKRQGNLLAAAQFAEASTIERIRRKIKVVKDPMILLSPNTVSAGALMDTLKRIRLNRLPYNFSSDFFPAATVSTEQHNDYDDLETRVLASSQEDHISLDVFVDMLLEMAPEDAASVLNQMNTYEADAVLEKMGNKGRAVFAKMKKNKAKAILDMISKPQVITMQCSEAAVVLADLPLSQAASLISKMNTDQADAVIKKMGLKGMQVALLQKKSQPNAAADLLLKMEPHIGARVLDEEMEVKDIATLLRRMTKIDPDVNAEKARAVLEHLSPEKATAVIEVMKPLPPEYTQQNRFAALASKSRRKI